MKTLGKKLEDAKVFNFVKLVLSKLLGVTILLLQWCLR